MTDGQYFYFAIMAGLALGVLLEHLWKRLRRRCPVNCPPDAPWHCECRAAGKR